jgi:hypothetical protein
VTADDPVVAFKRALKELRERSGNPSYRVLAGRAAYSHTMLSRCVSGPALPTWPVAAAFIRACGGDDAQWRDRWLAASQAPPRPAAAEHLRLFGADLASRLDGGSRSRRAIAARAGYASSSVSAVLAGHRLPSAEMLVALLQATGASTAEVAQWQERRLRLAGTVEAARLRGRIELIAAPVPESAAARGVPWRRATRVGAASTVAVAVAATGIAWRLHRPELASIGARVPHDFAPAVVLNEAAPRESASRRSPAAVSALRPGDVVSVGCRVVYGEPVTINGRTSTEWLRLLDGRYVHTSDLRLDGPVSICTDEGHSLVAADGYEGRHRASDVDTPVVDAVPDVDRVFDVTLAVLDQVNVGLLGR